MNNFERAKELLKINKQEHIINQMAKLPEEKRDDLINQVLNIDFDELSELYEKTFEPLYIDLEELQPIKAVNSKKIEKKLVEEYENIAMNIIKKNKFATVTMAGGQGTRLRLQYAKGYF